MGHGRTREEQMRAKRLKVHRGPEARARRWHQREERSVWREHPRHGWASHAADGFRTTNCRWPQGAEELSQGMVRIGTRCRRQRKKSRHPVTLGPKTTMRQ